MNRLRRMLHERCECAAARDPVDGESPRPLETAERAFRLRVEEPVDRDELTASCEQELQHGHVPPEGSAAQAALPEERPAERPERAAGGRARLSIDVEADPLLELPHAPDRRRAGDSVDGPQVRPVGAQRDLEARGLRFDAGRSRRRWQSGEEECNHADKAPHGRWFSPPRPVSCR